MNKEIYVNEVNSIKEVISNMPLATKKNKQKHLVYVKEKLDFFTKKREEIISEMKYRFDIIDKKIEINEIDYEKLVQEKEELFQKLMIFNRYNTPYEKTGLDRCVFNINHYYEENLDFLNQEIKNAVECFKKVGVCLNKDDFWYSDYVNEYMSVFFTNASDIKNKLDEIFWKAPNLIHQIAMSIRSLYFKYEKNFINYYEDMKNKILKESSYDDLVNRYNYLSIVIENKDLSMDVIYKNIMDGTLNLSDFSDEKYQQYINTLSDDVIDDDNMNKLFNTLYEYSIYKEYKFIIDKFIDIYKEKDKYKDVYKKLRKEIDKQEKKIYKLNKKIHFQQKWFKNEEKIEMLGISINNEISLLKDKYKTLEIDKIYEKISSLNNNTSYYDVLFLVASNYSFLREILMENNADITLEEIDRIELFLLTFVLSNRLTILDNISVLDETNITYVISSRYKLLNIKIEPDDVDNNLEHFMDTIKKINIINVLKKSSVTFDELEYQVNCKKFLIN